MPATGIPAGQSTQPVSFHSSLINDPPQFIHVLRKGTVSMNKSFESPPTASITYESCKESYANLIQASFSGARFSLFGIPFVVSSVQIKKSRHSFHPTTGTNRISSRFTVVDVEIQCQWRYNGALSSTVEIVVPTGRDTITISQIAGEAGVPYSGSSHRFEVKSLSSYRTQRNSQIVEVSLGGLVTTVARLNGKFVDYANGVVMRSLSGGAGYGFPVEQLKENGSVSYSSKSGYQNAELTWNRDPTTEDLDDTTYPIFELREPVTKTLVKESINLTIPPINSTLLKTIDSNAHLSGPKKTRIEATTIDNYPTLTKIKVFGFSYLSNQIVDADFELLPASLSPEIFWREVETQVSSYIYERGGFVRVEATASDPNNPDRVIGLILHPQYENIATVEVGTDNIIFQPQVEYLTKTTTVGYKMMPLKNETGEFEVAQLDPNDPDYDLLRSPYRIRLIPMRSEEQYLLKGLRQDLINLDPNNPNAVNDRQGSPFTVQWVKYENLSQQLRNLVARDPEEREQIVGVVIPDPTYKEPYYIKQEFSYKQGLASIADPDDPRKSFIAGEESLIETVRTLTSKNSYTEITESGSFQGAGFNAVAEEGDIEEKSGQPPLATTKDIGWEKRDPTIPPVPNTRERQLRYILNSPGLDNSANILGSANFSEASSRSQALTAARTEATIANINAASSTKTVCWYYPYINIGSRVNGDFVTGVSLTLNYQEDGKAICEGTQVTIGDYRASSVSVRTVPLFQEDQQNSGNPTFSTSVNNIGGDNTLGEIDLGAIPTRRRF